MFDQVTRHKLRNCQMWTPIHVVKITLSNTFTFYIIIWVDHLDIANALGRCFYEHDMNTSHNPCIEKIQTPWIAPSRIFVWVHICLSCWFSVLRFCFVWLSFYVLCPVLPVSLDAPPISYNFIQSYGSLFLRSIMYRTKFSWTPCDHMIWSLHCEQKHIATFNTNIREQVLC